MRLLKHIYQIAHVSIFVTSTRLKSLIQLHVVLKDEDTKSNANC